MAATSKSPAKSRGPMLFAAAAALFFFVSIIKFGSPVILDEVLLAPTTTGEAVWDSWHIVWGYRFLFILAAIGVMTMRWNAPGFKWFLVLPLLWLGWQFISASQTVSPDLTKLTLKYFTACIVLFYLGYFAMKDVRQTWPLWAGLGLALCWIMRFGLEQHFGGLEATRRYVYSLRNSGDVSLLNDPNYLKRIASNRIFATFSSPDAFAGLIELVLPVTLLFVWQITPKVRKAARVGFVLVLGGCGAACLFWSGSKAGWLVALLMGMVAVGQSNISIHWKRRFIFTVLILGVAGFGVKYSTFFQKQKNSVGARFTYWRAALRITADHPLLGTGPGTFSVPYKQLLRPGDEATQLCHNDYLEQACDSGLPGFFSYSLMILGFLWFLYRYRIKKSRFTIEFLVWLGLVGLALHSLVDYHLYVPALAWPMFFLLGWSMKSQD